MNWEEFFDYASEKLHRRYNQTSHDHIMMGHITFYKRLGMINVMDPIGGEEFTLCMNVTPADMKIILDILTRSQGKNQT